MTLLKGVKRNNKVIANKIDYKNLLYLSKLLMHSYHLMADFYLI